MARHATIIGEASDIWGDLWDVREERTTDHGFPVLLGWPTHTPRGPGGGGPRAIVTPALAAYLESRRYPARGVSLPLGATAVKRLRRLVQSDRPTAYDDWWDARLLDLATLTIAEFAARHGVSPGATERARLHYLGRMLRPAHWWRTAEARELLGLATAIAAERLGLATSSVRRLRAAVAVEA